MRERINFDWKRDLGSPERPGVVTVPGQGVVTVSQKDIDTANEHWGDVTFTGINVSNKDSQGRTEFILGLATSNN